MKLLLLIPLYYMISIKGNSCGTKVGICFHIFYVWFSKLLSFSSADAHYALNFFLYSWLFIIGSSVSVILFLFLFLYQMRGFDIVIASLPLSLKLTVH